MMTQGAFLLRAVVEPREGGMSLMKVYFENVESVGVGFLSDE